MQIERKSQVQPVDPIARVPIASDTGRELREIVEEREIAPGVVRDLWHEWLMHLDESEENRRKSVQEE